MTNIKADNRIEIRVTKEEKELFKEKMYLAKTKTLTQFIKKCVLSKKIIVVDMVEIRKLYTLMSNATNNINQIARGINTNGAIYKNDIEIMKKDIKEVKESIFNIEKFIHKNRSK